MIIPRIVREDQRPVVVELDKTGRTAAVRGVHTDSRVHTLAFVRRPADLTRFFRLNFVARANEKGVSRFDESTLIRRESIAPLEFQRRRIPINPGP